MSLYFIDATFIGLETNNNPETFLLIRDIDTDETMSVDLFDVAGISSNDVVVIGGFGRSMFTPTHMIVVDPTAEPYGINPSSSKEHVSIVSKFLRGDSYITEFTGFDRADGNGKFIVPIPIMRNELRNRRIYWNESFEIFKLDDRHDLLAHLAMIS